MKKLLSLLLALSLLLSALLLTSCGDASVAYDYLNADYAAHMAQSTEELQSATVDLGAYLEELKVDYSKCYDLPTFMDSYKTSLFWKTLMNATSFSSLPEGAVAEEMTILKTQLEYYFPSYQSAYASQGIQLDFETYAELYFGYDTALYSSADDFIRAEAGRNVRRRMALFGLASALQLVPNEEDIQKAYQETLQTIADDAEEKDLGAIERFYRNGYGPHYLRGISLEELVRDRVLAHVDKNWTFRIEEIPEEDKPVFDKTEPDLNQYETSDEITDLVKIDIENADKSISGSLYIRLYPSNAPKTVKYFQDLVKNGAYNGKLFHLVEESFRVQAGMSADGKAPSTEKLDGEFYANGEGNHLSHTYGVVSMWHPANSYSGADGRFFISTTNTHTADLDGYYAAFGYVLNGMDLITQIVRSPLSSNGMPQNTVTIVSTSFLKPIAE